MSRMRQSERTGYQPAKEAVDIWDSAPAATSRAARLISVSIPAPDLDLHTLLRASVGTERFYWAEPEQSGAELRFAAAGIAAELKVLAGVNAVRTEQDVYGTIELQADDWLASARQFVGVAGQETVREVDATALPELAPRFFGGFAFQPQFVPDNTWSTFHPAHFVLPHFLLIKQEGNTWLTIHGLANGDEPTKAIAVELLDAVRARYEMLRDAQRGETKLNQPLPVSHAGDTQSAVWTGIRFPMPYSAWHEMVEQARQAIASQQLQKVVLSRVCEVRHNVAIDPLPAVTFLDELYPSCYRFLYEAVPGHAFFGASPELLISRNGAVIKTMGLAGSIGRGQTVAEDRALASDLLASQKDMGEHQLVVEAIRQRLMPRCGHLEVAREPDILRFRNIQHLYTPIAGELIDAATTSVLDLVRELHPTPALGGVPRDKALDFLIEAEPVPRGWYAGPIGWFDGSENGTFSVAIRSAVTQHQRAWLYAGAGIVADSDPEKEWSETELKFRPILEALAASQGAKQ